MRSTILRPHEVTLSASKVSPLEISSIVSSSAGKAFASALDAMADSKFTQDLINKNTGCFVSPEGFLELFANKEQKEGWYHIVKDQNGNLKELVSIEAEELAEYEKNETVFIHLSAFQTAKEGKPLALGCDNTRDDRLYLIGYSYGGLVAWVALSSQVQAQPGQGGRTQAGFRGLRNDGERLSKLVSRVENNEGRYRIQPEDFEFLRGLARKLNSLPETNEE